MANAKEGILVIKGLIERIEEWEKNGEKRDSPLIILPGCGINAENVSAIIKETGAKEIHSSCSNFVLSNSQFVNDKIPSFYERRKTSRNIVSQIISSMEATIN